MHFHIVLALLSTTVLLLSTANAWPPRGEPVECAVPLISLSPCLSYISALPNYEHAPAPSLPCCGAFIQSVAYGGAACMCYLVQDPLLLGFPVDKSRLLSLFPLCSANDSSSANSWLYQTCLATENFSAISSMGPSSDFNSTGDELWAIGGPAASPPHSNAPDRVRMDPPFRSFIMVLFVLSIFIFVH